MTTPADVARPGFVLYVTLSAADAPGASTAHLAEAAETLRELALDLLPAAETFTALALAPQRTDAVLRLLTGLSPAALGHPAEIA